MLDRSQLVDTIILQLRLRHKWWFVTEQMLYVTMFVINQPNYFEHEYKKLF